MIRTISLALLLMAYSAGCGWADDQGDPATEANQAADSAAEKLKENPDDVTALQTYMNLSIRRLVPLMSSQPDAAEKQLAELRKTLAAIEPTTDEAKELLARANQTLTIVEQQIQLHRTSLEELAAKLKDDPEDAQSVSLYANKALMSLASLARSEPEKAEAQLKSVLETLEKHKEAAEGDEAKEANERAARSLARLESLIEDGKKLTALIGTEAPPLAVESWANGEPLTSDDLKGKVVLLDFWAVWCGPCIATFPHLREWQEKYSEQGLVIIGVTDYYQYRWDEEAERAVRSDDDISREEERAMLDKFAEHHELKHRFALDKDDAMSTHYAVSGIPHVVVIDRQGKIRLMRVGSGEENAKAIGDMIAKLIEYKGGESALKK